MKNHFKKGDIVIAKVHDDCDKNCKLRNRPCVVTEIYSCGFYMDVQFYGVGMPRLKYNQTQLREASEVEKFVFRVKHG